MNNIAYMRKTNPGCCYPFFIVFCRITRFKNKFLLMIRNSFTGVYHDKIYFIFFFKDPNMYGSVFLYSFYSISN